MTKNADPSETVWFQRTIVLAAKPRGIHLVTTELERELPEIRKVKIGILHLFLQHTSASLTVNENADPDVRRDLDDHLSRLVPDGAPHFRHTLEGPDDITAHIKASLLGVSVTVPISAGDLALGTWQGIYLCEHRSSGGARQIVATVTGLRA